MYRSSQPAPASSNYYLHSSKLSTTQPFRAITARVPVLHRHLPTKRPSQLSTRTPCKTPSKMPSDLSTYLASHYLTADPKPSSSSKKRKRKDKDPSAGLLITDDSETGWTRPSNAEDEDENTPTTVAGTSAEFRKAKKSGWKVVGAPAPPTSSFKDDAAADAILASAAAESAEAGGHEDDAPAVMMSDGTYAGLQSASAVSTQLARRKAIEEAEFAKIRKSEKEAETVYRDATGRRVDIGFKRAEARRLAAEAAEKEVKAKEALRGEVQIEEARRRREQLEDAKVMGVARGKDDEEMNRELKAKARWGDTMAEFVGKDQGGAIGAAGGKAGSKRNKGRPAYQGGVPPNRYGIRPGYRWDGVDRGNGFEAERFKAINRVERNKGLEYNWQMDE
ncbi:Pre-mRNA-splicing factor of RES complex-domain-containing protein [Xylariales sp. AK1849]|nr:Pre-mRNA-splicing factor of RES complex-domain-containing protein [Xylariales sp. AK1849]